MRPIIRSCLLVQTALLFGLSPLTAQTILVTVTELETGRPIPGAFLSLSGADGALIRQALSNAQGRFLFRVGSTGMFSVRGEMIGRQSREASNVKVGPGENRALTLELPVNPIPLEGIQVEGEGRCRLHPNEASALTTVWEEARKALSVQEWTEREGLYRFQLVTFERDMDTDARLIEAEARQISRGVSKNPIRSAPAQELIEHGFIQPRDDGGWTFFGPDATVLLSDEFLDTHCFRLRTDPQHPDALGLAFEPVRAGSRPDIQGTLWLDRASSTLKVLEFGYRWPRYPEARGVARGRVEFEALPNGTWIVRRWWIRMPRLSRDRSFTARGGSGVFVSGIREGGAVVEQIATLDRQTVAEGKPGTVTGLVWDSTRHAPLVGAAVFLSGTSYSDVSDSLGHFLVGDVPQGAYRAAFTHSRLTALGVFSPLVEVEVSSGGLSETLLAVPGLESIQLNACRGTEDWGGGSIFLTGVVRDRNSGEAIPNATVSFRWQETLDLNRLLETRFETPTNDDGRYTACGLPDETLIIVQAAFNDRQSDTVHVRAPEEPFPAVDLEIALFPPQLEPPNAVRIEPSVESKRDSFDNALAESVTGLFKTEVIRRRGPWRNVPGRFKLALAAYGTLRVEGPSRR